MARAGTSRHESSTKNKFPYGPKFDKVLQDAAQIERARYHQGVRGTAKDIVEEHGDDDDGIQERISSDADSAVTYTRDAWQIAWLSDNVDAIEDALGDDPADWGATGVTDLITKIAYFAYEKDLREYVEVFQREGAPDENPSRRRASSGRKKSGRKKTGRKKTSRKKSSRRR